MAKIAPDPGHTLERKGSQDSGEKLNINKQEVRRRSDLFTFANAEYVKAKVKQERNPEDAAYNVFDFYYEKGFFQRIARHQRFENVTLSIIVINALWISIDTDVNTADTILGAHAVFVTADVMFFAYFFIELFIRFMAFKNKCNCRKDGWFVFDTTLVTLYAFDPFVIGLMAHMSGGEGLNLPTAVLRLFRLARLSRLVRMLRSLPELMMMIKGMVTATTSVCYCFGLLLMITYVFAIAIVNVAPKTDPDGEYGEDFITLRFFSTVPEAMHNMILYLTFQDELADCIIKVKVQSTICFVLCWMFVALSGMTVMNMLIGVLCEIISAVAASEKEAMLVDAVNEEFGVIVQELDTNSDGVLCWEEFEKIMDHPGALEGFERVGVDAAVMVELSEDFFFEDGEPVAVEFHEFMDMVLDLRGGQEATIKDVMRMGTRHSYKFEKFNDRVVALRENLGKVLDAVKDGQASTTQIVRPAPWCSSDNLELQKSLN